MINVSGLPLRLRQSSLCTPIGDLRGSMELDGDGQVLSGFTASSSTSLLISSNS